jgi:hypothetical protein
MWFDDRQQLLRLVVEGITVEDDVFRVETVIPVDDGKLRHRRPELVEGLLKSSKSDVERTVRRAHHERLCALCAIAFGERMPRMSRSPERNHAKTEPATPRRLLVVRMKPLRRCLEP